jgi:hypothetical protein
MNWRAFLIAVAASIGVPKAAGAQQPRRTLPPVSVF